MCANIYDAAVVIISSKNYTTVKNSLMNVQPHVIL